MKFEIRNRLHFCAAAYKIKLNEYLHRYQMNIFQINQNRLFQRLI